MSRRIRIFQVDAFTADRFTGNPAGVVLDADSLSDAEMLAIARERRCDDIERPGGVAARLLYFACAQGGANALFHG